MAFRIWKTDTVMSRIVPVVLSGSLLALAACGGGSDDASSATTTTDAATETVATAAPATTAEPESPTTVALVVEGATVVVANGNIIGGSAGRMSDALALEGFETGTPVDGSVKVEASVVYYTADDAAAEVVAESLAIKLGGINVEPLPETVPIEGEFTGGVLLVLGNVQADKSIAELSGVTVAVAADVDAVANEGSTVVVANGSGVSGSAGRMSSLLEAAGFTVGTPTNSTAQASESVIYYDENGDDAAVVKADADALAAALGGLTVLALPADVPTDSGSLDGDILLVLGTNEADKSLTELAG
jgi:hypothetical protein